MHWWPLILGSFSDFIARRSFRSVLAAPGRALPVPCASPQRGLIGQRQHRLTDQDSLRLVTMPRKSRRSQIHPVSVMGGADAQSRKRYGGFGPLLEKSCLSASDPKVVVQPWQSREIAQHTAFLLHRRNHEVCSSQGLSNKGHLFVPVSNDVDCAHAESQSYCSMLAL